MSFYLARRSRIEQSVSVSRYNFMSNLKDTLCIIPLQWGYFIWISRKENWVITPVSETLCELELTFFVKHNCSVSTQMLRNNRVTSTWHDSLHVCFIIALNIIFLTRICFIRVIFSTFQVLYNSRTQNHCYIRLKPVMNNFRGRVFIYIFFNHILPFHFHTHAHTHTHTHHTHTHTHIFSILAIPVKVAPFT